MSAPPVFTAHDTADLVNALPVSFGFTPEESLCVIATNGPRRRFGFSARLDLPNDLVSALKAAQVLIGHLLRHGADGAIVVSVSADPDRAKSASTAMLDVLEADGRIEPVVIAWADDSTVWATHDPDGTAYERSAHHRAVVQAVVEGRDIVATRAELERRVKPVEGVKRIWIERSAGEAEDRMMAELAASGERTVVAGARRQVMSLMRRASDLSDGEVLELSLWVQDLEVRDLCLEYIDGENASAMLAGWQRAARLAPRALGAPALCLAAAAAHRIGDGAQMRIALDAAAVIDPLYPLAGLLTRLLDAGIGPKELAEWQVSRDHGPHRG